MSGKCLRACFGPDKTKQSTLQKFNRREDQVPVLRNILCCWCGDVDRSAGIPKVIQKICNRGGTSVPTFVSEVYSASLPSLFSFLGASSLDCGGTLTSNYDVVLSGIFSDTTVSL